MSITVSILSKIKQTAKLHSLWRQGDHVLIALSGGVDSIAMAEALLLLSEETDLSFVCAHFNHMFRGEEAVRDENFCRAYADQRKIPFVATRTDVPALCRKHSGSSQMVAREARYAFLEKVAVENGCQRVALAHNQNDKIETFLMKIFSGSSPAALSSIPYKRDQFIRPLLDVSRDLIERFVEERALSFVEDSSNSEQKYRRNSVRHSLLPTVAKIFPNYEHHLLHLMDLVNTENHAWQDMFVSFLEKHAVIADEYALFELEKLRALPLAAVKRLLAQYIAHFCVYGRMPVGAFFDRVEYLLLAGHGERIWYQNRSVTVKESGKWLKISTSRDIEECQAPENFYLELLLDSETTLFGKKFLLSMAIPLRVDRNFFQEEVKKGIFWLNVEQTSFPLVGRSRCDGDRISLSGTGTKKIKDLLIDGHVPRSERKKCVIIEDKQAILACIVLSDLAKSRIAKRGQINESQRCLRLEIRS